MTDYMCDRKLDDTETTADQETLLDPQAAHLESPMTRQQIDSYADPTVCGSDLSSPRVESLDLIADQFIELRKRIDRADRKLTLYRDLLREVFENVPGVRDYCKAPIFQEIRDFLGLDGAPAPSNASVDDLANRVVEDIDLWSEIDPEFAADVLHYWMWQLLKRPEPGAATSDASPALDSGETPAAD